MSDSLPVEPAVAAQPEPERELDRGDLLSMSHINSLPGPLFIRLAGDKEFSWPLEYIDVETGLIKFDVCGKLQSGHIGDVAQFRDSSGTVHDSETFYSDFIVDPAAQPVGEPEIEKEYCPGCHFVNRNHLRHCPALQKYPWVEPKPAPQATPDASKPIDLSPIADLLCDRVNYLSGKRFGDRADAVNETIVESYKRGWNAMKAYYEQRNKPQATADAPIMNCPHCNRPHYNMEDSEYCRTVVQGKEDEPKNILTLVEDRNGDKRHYQSDEVDAYIEASKAYYERQIAEMEKRK